MSVKKFIKSMIAITAIVVSCLNTYGASYTTKAVPVGASKKTYMSYKSITDRTSCQYKLQKRATTGKYGIRTIDGRYCIAVGSYYCTTIGTKLDIIMKNGTIVKCVLADGKDNKHTDSSNRLGKNGCIVEFIVDTKSLDKTCKKMGDMSYVSSGGLKGAVKSIRVYDETV